MRLPLSPMLALTILAGTLLATPPASASRRVDTIVAGAALLAVIALWLLWRHYRLRQTLAQLGSQLARERALRGAAERALIDIQASLCRLAAQHNGVQEAERRRIARDIHDDLGQHLLTLKMDFIALHADIGRAAGNAAAAAPLDGRLVRLEQRIDLAVRSLRAILDDLRPAALHHGLHGALTHHLADFSRLSGIRCQLLADADALVAVEDCGAETMVYRVVQEALANVARHARASSVSVALSRQPRRLAMTVSDNGVGLPQAADGARCGRGLDGMHERVSDAGGRLEILSAPGRGTTLLISMPLAAA
jgi:signal transduction histidine kinase